MKILNYLEKQDRFFILLITFLAMIGVGFLDYLTGYELSFSVFYVLPIALATWLLPVKYGLGTSLLSALIWFAADRASNSSYSHALIPVWNGIIRLSFFLIITLLLSSLKSALKYETELARLDNLTGSANSRAFYEILQMEVERSKRYKQPFTIAYIDLDNFKTVNDQQGHLVGDQVLCEVVNHMKKNLRSVDVVARLGGDEFALLLPETNQEQAQTAITKLQKGLLAKMEKEKWPITFSIGVVTSSGQSYDTIALINTADRLMYTVKHGRKNGLLFIGCEEEPQ